MNKNFIIPKNLKISISTNGNSFVLKLINKIGVIKKIIKNKTLKITIDSIHQNLLLENSPNKKYSKNSLFIYKIIIKQLILSMFKPFRDRLILEGVGYKVWKKKRKLKFKLGFSKPVFLKIPKGISVSIYKLRKITISSLSLQYLRIFRQKLRLLRVPDSYKKKGIRYYKEIFKLKEGKKTR